MEQRRKNSKLLEHVLFNGRRNRFAQIYKIEKMCLWMVGGYIGLMFFNITIKMKIKWSACYMRLRPERRVVAGYTDICFV